MMGLYCRWSWRTYVASTTFYRYWYSWILCSISHRKNIGRSAIASVITFGKRREAGCRLTQRRSLSFRIGIICLHTVPITTIMVILKFLSSTSRHPTAAHCEFGTSWTVVLNDSSENTAKKNSAEESALMNFAEAVVPTHYMVCPLGWGRMHICVSERDPACCIQSWTAT